MIGVGLPVDKQATVKVCPLITVMLDGGREKAGRSLELSEIMIIMEDLYQTLTF